jgi:hypothetical protein
MISCVTADSEQQAAPYDFTAAVEAYNTARSHPFYNRAAAQAYTVHLQRILHSAHAQPGQSEALQPPLSTDCTRSLVNCSTTDASMQEQGSHS